MRLTPLAVGAVLVQALLWLAVLGRLHRLQADHAASAGEAREAGEARAAAERHASASALPMRVARASISQPGFVCEISHFTFHM